MTKEHFKAYSKLRAKTVNANDVIVVAVSETSATFFLMYPGLYLTYDHKGRLIETETTIERQLHHGLLARPGEQASLSMDGEATG